jgi:putative mRNA 3-end processing factor
LKNCWVSLHPAGHIYGSSQIRIETEQEVCVVSGDYKRAFDPTCKPFEIVECDTFVTESTFALPIYQWESSEISIQKIYDWWMENRARGFNSVLFCYALGKAQRVMKMLSKLNQGPIYLHGAILSIAEIYVKQGISLIPFLPAISQEKTLFRGDLILAPPSAKGTPWLKRFYPYKSGFVSGWMQVRGARKQRNIDTGFVLSDHADWPDLLKTIKDTKASQIITTHGNSVILSRYLNDIGLFSQPLQGTELLEKEES